jgi:enoyl-CoA hydratase/carnithine racemase
MTDIDYTVERHIATIRFNRPDVLNAMGAAMREELSEVVRRFRSDDDAWVAIITGNGRSFCAGRNIKEQVAATGHRTARTYTADHNLFGIADTDKPLIAAVNGYAMGLGWYIVAACDIRIAADNAIFGMTEIPTGVLGPYWFPVAEVVPWPLGAEFALLGERVPASRLREANLLNAVVPAEDLMPTAMSWAEKFVKLPPLHVRRTKALMQSMRHLPDEQTFAQEREARTYLIPLEDSQEAARAFVERRTPVYQAR